MKIENLCIQHFRGIEYSNISFPSDTRMICLIGAGDSTKTTILRAIEWVLWPAWNLYVSDNDFYNGDITRDIIIQGTFSELPSTLLSDEKYGLFLRRNGVQLDCGLDDEPKDGEPICLTIQFTVDKSLEPKWEVVCNRKEPKNISYKDRKSMSIGSVGEKCDKDLMWGRYSILQKYSDAKGILQDAYTTALREVACATDFRSLDDEISPTLLSLGHKYGVEFNNDIKNRMIMQNGSFSSAIGLFDGNAPLCQRGLGSQRLLSMGLNINVASGDTLLLIDEVENGLEPYRICSLINEFRENHCDSGQIIMTTHSPVVVAECIISELLVIQSIDGNTSAHRLKSGDEKSNRAMQAEVRKNAAAFLCKRLIVCEGKTEIGLIRALDNFLARECNYRLSYKGIGTANGDGSNIFKCADVLRSCGYKICLLMDSDLDGEENLKEDQRTNNKISIFDWEKGNALEEQVFKDIPITLAEQLLEIAIREHGSASICFHLDSMKIPHSIQDDNIKLSNPLPVKQEVIGTIAKRKKVEWYKRTDLGEALGNILFSNWSMINPDTKLRKTIMDLSAWVMKDD